MAKTTEAQKRATMKYIAANYKRVPLNLRIPEYEELKKVAEASGESITAYIRRAIEMRMEAEQVIDLTDLLESQNEEAQNEEPED